MAPKLDERTREQIALMITMPNLTNADIARITKVHARTVVRHRENMEKHGKTVIREYERHNPTMKLLPEHQEDAIKYMNEHPEAQLNEAATHLKDKHSISVTRSTISRLLKKRGWKTKRALIKDQRIKDQADRRQVERRGDMSLVNAAETEKGRGRGGKEKDNGDDDDEYGREEEEEEEEGEEEQERLLQRQLLEEECLHRTENEVGVGEGSNGSGGRH